MMINRKFRVVCIAETTSTKDFRVFTEAVEYAKGICTATNIMRIDEVTVHLDKITNIETEKVAHSYKIGETQRLK